MKCINNTYLKNTGGVIMKINTINSYYRPIKSTPSFTNTRATDTVISAPKQDVTQFKKNINQEIATSGPIKSTFKSLREAVRNFFKPDLSSSTFNVQDLSDLLIAHVYSL